jgi:hypothetical protein
MVDRFRLDPDLAIRTDNVRGGFAADQALSVLPLFDALCIKDHLKKLAFRNVSFHLQVLTEDRHRQLPDLVFFDELGVIIRDNDVRRYVSALERQADGGLGHGPAQRAIAFHKDLYLDVMVKVFQYAPHILREPDFVVGQGLDRVHEYVQKNVLDKSVKRSRFPFASLKHDGWHALNAVLMRLVPVHDQIIGFKGYLVEMRLDGLRKRGHFRTCRATRVAREKDQPDRFVETACGRFYDFQRSFRYHDNHPNKKISEYA